MFYLLGQILDWVQDLDWQGWLSAKQERKKKPIKTLLKKIKWVNLNKKWKWYQMQCMYTCFLTKFCLSFSSHENIIVIFEDLEAFSIWSHKILLLYKFYVIFLWLIVQNRFRFRYPDTKEKHFLTIPSNFVWFCSSAFNCRFIICKITKSLQI